MQYRGNRIVSGPAAEPVAAADLRTQLRTDSTDLPDAQADGYISEARQEIEDQTGLALITQTWKLTLDRWPSSRGEPWWDGTRQIAISELDSSAGTLILPRYPLQSISSVTTYSEDGTSTAVAVSSTFDIDAQQMPGRMRLQSGATWPTALRPTNAIEVTYIAGYGAAASSVPAPLVRAVRNMAAHIYANRGDCTAGDAYQASGAAAVCEKYRARMV